MPRGLSSGAPFFAQQVSEVHVADRRRRCRRRAGLCGLGKQPFGGKETLLRRGREGRRRGGPGPLSRERVGRSGVREATPFPCAPHPSLRRSRRGRKFVRAARSVPTTLSCTWSHLGMGRFWGGDGARRLGRGAAPSFPAAALRLFLVLVPLDSLRFHWTSSPEMVKKEPLAVVFAVPRVPGAVLSHLPWWLNPTVRGLEGGRRCFLSERILDFRGLGGGGRGC